MSLKKIGKSLPLEVPTAKRGADPFIKGSAAYGTSGSDMEEALYNAS